MVRVVVVVVVVAINVGHAPRAALSGTVCMPVLKGTMGREDHATARPVNAVALAGARVACSNAG